MMGTANRRSEPGRRARLQQQHRRAVLCGSSLLVKQVSLITRWASLMIPARKCSADHRGVNISEILLRLEQHLLGGHRAAGAGHHAIRHHGHEHAGQGCMAEDADTVLLFGSVTGVPRNAGFY